MYISSINKVNIVSRNNTNFKGGNISLKILSPKNICTYEAIKKIAEEKDVDIFVSHYTKSKLFPTEDIYSVIASKNKNSENGKYESTIKGANVVVVSKTASIEEISVKIFNTVVSAIENLEEKLNNTQKKFLL